MTRHTFRDLQVPLPGGQWAVQVKYTILMLSNGEGRLVRRAFWAFQHPSVEASFSSTGTQPDIARHIELQCLADDVRRRASA